jgi:hypothetical protein
MIAWLACETGIAPSALMQESDRMLFTMTRYLSWRSVQHTRAVKS